MDYEILAVTNAHSSNALRVKKKLLQLEKALKEPVKTIPTHKDVRVFERTFKKAVGEAAGPIVVLIGGGDGTVHQVVKTTLQLNIKDPSNVILLPIWGGNANDFAYMLNGLGLRKNLADIIKNGVPVAIHPLEIELSGKKTTQIDYAICYASFGASAFAAEALDKSGPARKGRFGSNSGMIIVGEIIHVVGAFLHAPLFRAQVNGERVEFFEQVFANGSRIAKMDRLPVNLTDKAFYKIAQPTKNPTMILRLLKALTGKEIGEVTDKPVSFQVKEPVLGQYDGEVVRIPKNTVVKIRLSEKKIYALATKSSLS